MFIFPSYALFPPLNNLVVKALGGVAGDSIPIGEACLFSYIHFPYGHVPFQTISAEEVVTSLVAQESGVSNETLPLVPFRD